MRNKFKNAETKLRERLFGDRILLPVHQLCALNLRRLQTRLFRKMNPGGFEKLWSENSRFPEKISLNLSLLCPSNCIYCAKRGIDIQPKMMDVELISKILKEAKSMDFAGQFSLGENGEALMHPKFQKIISDVREMFPGNRITLYTNMILMDENYAKCVLENELSWLHFNLDGASEKTYEYVKRNRSFEVVKKNIFNFIRMRNERHSRCKIGVGFVSAKRFSEEIEDKINVFEDDEAEIFKLFKPYLRNGDEISRDEITLEKYQFILQRRKTEFCDLFERILKEIFIAANGNVYICCADYGVQSRLGNVADMSIAEVWSGELREKILKNLYFAENQNSFEVCKTCLPNLSSKNRDLYFKIKQQVRQLFRTRKLKFVDGELTLRPPAK
jgi:radical SAM protein with 4Fe4S-binding SPASM domain